jgi:hypothetical protein
MPKRARLLFSMALIAFIRGDKAEFIDDWPAEVAKLRKSDREGPSYLRKSASICG